MQVMLELVRQRWHEKAGFSLNRPTGAGCYILLHFLTPVTLNIRGATVQAEQGSLIVFSPDCPHGFVSREELIHDWMHLTGDVAGLMEEYGLRADTLYHPGVAAGGGQAAGAVHPCGAESERRCAAYSLESGDGGGAAADADADACGSGTGLVGAKNRGGAESQPIPAPRAVQGRL